MLVAGVCAAILTAASSAQPKRAVHPSAKSFIASYDVILTGGAERKRHRDSQASDPNDSVIVESDDSYTGRGILSVKVEDNGDLSPATNSFHYQSATWSLSGRNGTNGSSAPPATTSSAGMPATTGSTAAAATT